MEILPDQISLATNHETILRTSTVNMYWFWAQHVSYIAMIIKVTGLHRVKIFPVTIY